jgi:prevent-host-death family protein
MMFYSELMASIGIRELNQQTSQVLDRVRAGETIEITDRGVPVAEIRPVSRERSVLARLAAEGRLAPATIDPAVLAVLPKKPMDGVNVADLLAADREQERW